MLPEPEKKETKNANIYVLGDISNAAISNEKSKAQAASDRNESEWNNTEMLNGVSNYPSEPTFRETRGDKKHFFKYKAQVFF